MNQSKTTNSKKDKLEYLFLGLFYLGLFFTIIGFFSPFIEKPLSFYRILLTLLKVVPFVLFIVLLESNEKKIMLLILVFLATPSFADLIFNLFVKSQGVTDKIITAYNVFSVVATIATIVSARKKNPDSFLFGINFIPLFLLRIFNILYFFLIIEGLPKSELFYYFTILSQNIGLFFYYIAFIFICSRFKLLEKPKWQCKIQLFLLQYCKPERALKRLKKYLDNEQITEAEYTSLRNDILNKL